MTIGERLREVRKSLGMNQTEFAAGIDLTYYVISKIESETSTPSFNVLMSVAEKYNVSLDWLLFGRGSMNILPPDHILNKADDDMIEFFTSMMQLHEDIQDRLFGIMADFLEILFEQMKKEK